MPKREPSSDRPVLGIIFPYDPIGLPDDTEEWLPASPATHTKDDCHAET